MEAPPSAWRQLSRSNGSKVALRCPSSKLPPSEAMITRPVPLSRWRGLADGRQVPYGVAWVRVRIDGRTQPTIAIFGDAGSEPLLGGVTLEEFGLAADPVTRRLIPVPGLLK